MNVSGTPSRYSASLMALATTGPATLETMMQSTLTPAGKWLNASAEPACAVANAARNSQLLPSCKPHLTRVLPASTARICKVSFDIWFTDAPRVN